MSTSEKKIEANRQNAKKSTGPNTDAGKKASSQNAITHGLHATDIVINSPHLKESRTLYDQLVDSLFEELKPTGVFQQHLVLKIANCIWRYRRAINAETATVNDQLTASFLAPLPIVSDDIDSPDQPHESTQRARACVRSIPYGSMGRALLRYEWRLDRELYRTYKLLRTIQRKTSIESKKRSKKDVKI